MNVELNSNLVCQNVKRIVELVPVIQSMVNAIDFETSTSVSDKEKIIFTAELLETTLSQMDSDLSALITILNC